MVEIFDKVSQFFVLGRDWEGIGKGLGRDWEGNGKGLGRDWEGTGKGLGRDWDYPVSTAIFQ